MMKKNLFDKFVSVMIVILFVLQSFAWAEEDTNNAKAINLQVNLVIDRLFDNAEMPNCTPLDIRGSVNMGFSDEVEGDGKGGWTDQGSGNDMGLFTAFGKQTYLKVTFDIIDPASNDGKSCIILRGQNNQAFPLSAEVPVNAKAGGMYVLHSTAWGAGEKAGTYTFIYEDGTSAYFDVVGNSHIFDFWSSKGTNNAPIVWNGKNRNGQNISFSMFALNNPNPDKTIKSIRFESDGAVQFINIIAVTLTDGIPVLPKSSESGGEPEGLIRYGVSSWKEFNTPMDKDLSGTVLDMSEYLDAPAGKHGKLGVVKNKLVFANGTKAKFWGANILGNMCFPDNDTADMLAGRLANCGYNLVRFVGIDKTILSNEKLESFSYFLNRLKEKGIYVYISLSSGDNFKNNESALSRIFDDKKIAQQKKFINTLFSYKGSKDKTTIAQNPQIVMVDMADQYTMYDYQPGLTCFNLNDAEHKILQNKFNVYLKNKYKTTANLRKHWKDVLENESIENKTVKINENWKYGVYDTGRRQDIIEFYAYLQQNYYNTMTAQLKKLGYGGLATGFVNAWDNQEHYTINANAGMDYLPINSIASWEYDRESKWHYLAKLKDDLVYTDGDSAILSDGRDGKNLIKLFKNRISEKPYVITEWGAANISRLAADNTYLTALISAQQGWTPIQYSFVNDNIAIGNIEDLYSVFDNPVALGMSYGAAALYYSVEELETVKTVHQNKTEAENHKSSNLILSDYIGNKTYTAYGEKESTSKKGIIFKNMYSVGNKDFKWDMIDGKFKVDTGNVIAFAGSVAGKDSIGCFDFDIYASEAVMSLVSLDKKDIKNSSHMLLSIADSQLNSSVVFKSAYLILEKGEGARYQNMSGEFTLKTKRDYDVYALDFTGKRVKTVSTYKDNNGYTAFTLGSVGDDSINYEIVER